MEQKVDDQWIGDVSFAVADPAYPMMAIAIRTLNGGGALMLDEAEAEQMIQEATVTFQRAFGRDPK